MTIPYIKQITVDEALDFFLNDLKLAESSLSDLDLETLKTNKLLQWDPNLLIIGLYEDNQLVMINVCQLFTPLAINLHSFVSSGKQGKFKALDYFEHIRQWFKNNMNFTQFVFTVPSKCFHVIRVLNKLKANFIGRLPNSMVWRSKKVDLLIFNYNIIEDK